MYHKWLKIVKYFKKWILVHFGEAKYSYKNNERLQVEWSSTKERNNIKQNND